jgi:DNA-binding CsgD family transcriptional regulator
LSSTALFPEWPDPELCEDALERVGTTLDQFDRLLDHRLTRRERQVVQLMSRGHSYQQTADELGLSIETVKSHLKSARRGLAARNTVHAVAEALRKGLIR